MTAQTDAQTAAFVAVGHLVMTAIRERARLYRIEHEDGTTETLHVTPSKAAQYSARYDATVTPISPAPLAPEGTLERAAPLAAERPRP